MTTVALVIAGALGAPARFLVEREITARHGHTFPWGTTVVNLAGCLALGVLAGLADAGHAGPDVVRVVGTGFLGAFTTFSAFTVEALHLDRRRRRGYVALSLVGGVALAAAGLLLGGG